MRKDYQPGVLQPVQRSASEITARDEFNPKHPPIEGLVVPHDLQVIESSEGTLFAPPRWAWHQHFHLDGDDTSRYLAIQDTGLLRTMKLHQIERHSVQLTPEDGKRLLDQAVGERLKGDDAPE